MSDVYFLFAHRANAIKIGVASNPHKRIRSIQTPEPCRLVGLMTGVGVEGEAALHGDFKHLRTHGEWFTATDELRAYVEQHAEGVPGDTWARVEARPRKRSRNRQSQKRRNRAADAAPGDRIFFIYECYGADGEFLFVARSINPHAHWAEKLKQSSSEWTQSVARFRVRGPYTKSTAAEMYSAAVERDPIHVNSAPTTRAAEASRSHFVRTATRIRMDRGDSWEQAIMPALEEADAIDFRALVSEQKKTASCATS